MRLNGKPKLVTQNILGLLENYSKMNRVLKEQLTESRTRRYVEYV